MSDSTTRPKVTRSDEEWRHQLTSQQYRVSRQGATEPPFSGEYVHTQDRGVYRCVACATELFSSETKYESGTGWPSFYEPVSRENVELEPEHSFGRRRTEVKCAVCDAHLGHLFEDGPRPTGLRYCINSAALDLERRN